MYSTKYKATKRTSYKMRSNEDGYGGYALKIRKGLVLDCYKYRQTEECWASFANSSSSKGKLIDTKSKDSQRLQQDPTKSNARIVVQNNMAYIVSIDTIQPGHEILVKYGRAYIFETSGSN